MTAAIIGLVVWLIVGFVGTWVGFISILISLGTSVFTWIESRRSRRNWGLTLLISVVTLGWTILWIVMSSLQILRIVELS